MARIRVLDSATINKIAAGEVIERPVSIVKELVENSIDAGATAITVEVRDGGISYLRVSDNGSGMAADDVRNAFLRHATSKIRSAEDLESVISLGFRGEALASIAAVARVELITKTPEALTGVHYVIEGGKEQLFEEVAAVTGTTLKVEELFYNVPARRKFLKKPSTEAAAVTELMQKMALGHPEISFQYIRGNSRVLSTPGDGSLKNAVYAIYGKEMPGELIPVDYSGALKIKGYVSRPQMTRVNRNYHMFYLNGRLIRSSLIEKIIEECYKDLVMPGSYPVAFLFLIVEPGLVDVNVHPSKLEVRFSREDLVREEVYKAVSRALGQEDLATRMIQAETLPPSLRAETGETGKAGSGQAAAERKETAGAADASGWAYAFPETGIKARTSVVLAPEEKTPKAEVRYQAPFYGDRPGTRETYYAGNQEKMPPFGEDGFLAEESAAYGSGGTKEQQRPNQAPGKGRLPDPRLLKMVGQAFDTYWIAEYGDTLYIIDQHAAHERVLYDRVRKVLDTGTLDSQILLEPQTILLSPPEFVAVMDHKEIFSRMGFDVEPFGESTVIVRAVPYIFNGPLSADDFRDMAGYLQSGSRQASHDLLLDRMAMMSCKAAIKGNHPYSETEARTLFADLFGTANPYNCPHGRPTIVTMTKLQFDRLFKRIVG